MGLGLYLCGRQGMEEDKMIPVQQMVMPPACTPLPLALLSHKDARHTMMKHAVARWLSLTPTVPAATHSL